MLAHLVGVFAPFAISGRLFLTDWFLAPLTQPIKELTDLGEYLHLPYSLMRVASVQ
jgi:hypothetical protein